MRKEGCYIKKTLNAIRELYCLGFKIEFNNYRTASSSPRPLAL